MEPLSGPGPARGRKSSNPVLKLAILSQVHSRGSARTVRCANLASQGRARTVRYANFASLGSPKCTAPRPGESEGARALQGMQFGLPRTRAHCKVCKFRMFGVMKNAKSMQKHMKRSCRNAPRLGLVNPRERAHCKVCKFGLPRTRAHCRVCKFGLPRTCAHCRVCKFGLRRVSEVHRA